MRERERENVYAKHIETQGGDVYAKHICLYAAFNVAFFKEEIL